MLLFCHSEEAGTSSDTKRSRGYGDVNGVSRSIRVSSVEALLGFRSSIWQVDTMPAQQHIRHPHWALNFTWPVISYFGSAEQSISLSMAEHTEQSITIKHAKRPVTGSSESNPAFCKPPTSWLPNRKLFSTTCFAPIDRLRLPQVPNCRSPRWWNRYVFLDKLVEERYFWLQT
jgi:hypothetical protein